MARLPAAADEAAFAAACAQAAAGRYVAARDAFLELRARLAPPSAALELRLGDAHLQLAEHDAAFAAFERAAAIDPASYLAHAALARMRADRGDTAGAASALQEAERHAPASDAHAWRTIGTLHAEYWRWDEAERALGIARAADPADRSTAPLLATARHELGDDEGALAALAGAEGLGAALSRRLYLPQVYSDADDLQRWRGRYEAGLARMEEELPVWRLRAREVFDLNRTNFLLAYQGGDDLDLQRRHSRLLGDLAGIVHPEWREPRAVTFDGGRRLRVGFAGGIFRDCTAGRYFERWITALDPHRFERFVYHTAPIADDFTRRIAAASDRFVTLRSGSEESVARIAADRLDVLVQPEVGMTPLSYLLASLRVAPVQVAGWGHPVTTGGEGVDAYLTCGAMEPDDGARHYAERLVALPGLGVSYPAPVPAPAFTRGELRLPEDRRIYACPQSLFKIHPAMDQVFARVLAADPEGVIVFFQATARAVTERFAARVQRAVSAHGIAPGGQLKFLPRMNPPAFRRALAAADVALDTLHWSGGNTSLDALAAGVPVVTCAGEFMRGRQTAAMVRMAGVAELEAASAAELPALAVRIATDREGNRALRERIAAGRAALFEQEAPLAAFAEALLTLGSAR